MANHEKVFGICENKCLVETITKSEFDNLKNNSLTVLKFQESIPGGTYELTRHEDGSKYTGNIADEVVVPAGIYDIVIRKGTGSVTKTNVHVIGVTVVKDYAIKLTWVGSEDATDFIVDGISATFPYYTLISDDTHTVTFKINGCQFSYSEVWKESKNTPAVGSYYGKSKSITESGNVALDPGIYAIIAKGGGGGGGSGSYGNDTVDECITNSILRYIAGGGNGGGGGDGGSGYVSIKDDISISSENAITVEIGAGGASSTNGSSTVVKLDGTSILSASGGSRGYAGSPGGQPYDKYVDGTYKGPSAGNGGDGGNGGSGGSSGYGGYGASGGKVTYSTSGWTPFEGESGTPGSRGSSQTVTFNGVRYTNVSQLISGGSGGSGGWGGKGAYKYSGQKKVSATNGSVGSSGKAGTVDIYLKMVVA